MYAHYITEVRCQAASNIWMWNVNYFRFCWPQCSVSVGSCCHWWRPSWSLALQYTSLCVFMAPQR